MGMVPRLAVEIRHTRPQHAQSAALPRVTLMQIEALMKASFETPGVTSIDHARGVVRWRRSAL